MILINDVCRVASVEIQINENRKIFKKILTNQEVWCTANIHGKWGGPSSEKNEK